MTASVAPAVGSAPGTFRMLVVFDPANPGASAPALIAYLRGFRANDPVACTVAVTVWLTPALEAEITAFIRALADSAASLPVWEIVAMDETLSSIPWAAAWGPQGNPIDDAKTLVIAIESMYAVQRHLNPPAVSSSAATGAALHGTYVGNGRMMIRTQLGAALLAPAHDLSLTPVLMLHGTFEQPLQRFLARTIRRGDAVMDIGANFGVHTILMAHAAGPDGTVIAYEAVPDLADLLRDNLTMNGLIQQTTVLQKAAWSGPDVLRFTTTAKYRGNGSVRPKDAGYLERYGADEFQEIEVDAESPAVHASKGPFALIKMDVEGAEPHVLDGMDEMIRDGGVRVLVLEYLNWVLGAEGEARMRTIFERYRDLYGASFARLDGQGNPHPITVDAIQDIGELSEVIIAFPPR